MLERPSPVPLRHVTSVQAQPVRVHYAKSEKAFEQFRNENHEISSVEAKLLQCDRLIFQSISMFRVVWAKTYSDVGMRPTRDSIGLVLARDLMEIFSSWS